jgi:cell division septation protein DedD
MASADLVVVPAVDQLRVRDHLVAAQRIPLPVVADDGVAVEVRQEPGSRRRSYGAIHPNASPQWEVWVKCAI